jgi:hypothetical protein
MPSDDKSDCDVFDNQQAARFLGCSAGTLPIWRSEGRGPRFIRHGRYVRYRRIDLEDFLSRGLVDPEKKSRKR